MTVTLTRSIRTATFDQVDDAGRTVTVRLVPWDSPRTVADDPRRPYVETFARGGLDVPADLESVLIEREHGGPVVGVLTAVEDRPDGLYGTIRVSRSSTGVDTLADIEARILRGVSVEFVDTTRPTGDTVTRTAARLERVAFTLRPQLDAPILSVRSTPDQETTMDTDTDQTDTSTDTDQTDTSTEDTSRRSDPAHDIREPVRRSAPARHTRDTRTDRFPSFGAFVRSAALGELAAEEVERYHRSLTDVVTGDADGLIREQWSSEVIDLVRTYTPTIQAFRQIPLPTSGMQLSRPRVKVRPTVGKQSAEKATITSTGIEYEKVSWDIDTYAGGNDVSLQLLRRSEPSFLTEMMRLYTREMAQNMNAAAAASLVAAADTVNETPLEFTTADKFDELIIDASATFLTELRRFAEVIVMSVDLWSALGKAKDSEERPLYAGVNPANPIGTFNVADGAGNVRQLIYYVDPELGGKDDGIHAVVGVREAFVSAVGPMGTLSADVPSKIGRDIAVWQEAAFGAADAAGLMLVEEDD